MARYKNLVYTGLYLLFECCGKAIDICYDGGVADR